MSTVISEKEYSLWKDIKKKNSWYTAGSDVLDAGYRSLAIAIIEQACDDYVRLRRDKKNYLRTAQVHLSEVIRFFESGFCEMVLDVDGVTIMHALDRKIEAGGKIERARKRK